MPIITPAVLTVLTVGFQKAYQRGFDGGETHHDKIAMTVSSNTTSQQYGWLGQFPQFREWLTGERQLKDLQAHGFAIVNRKFESTVSVGRDNIADDQFGVFMPIFEEMGYRAKVHPDEMLFGLLKDGQTTLCYDGENFFDTDHPSVAADGSATTVSNLDSSGSGPFWYVIDASRGMKPLIWQERESYQFQAITSPTDHDVFMTDMYLYGVRARVNAGFGLWHLAYASNTALDGDHFAPVVAHMRELRGDKGRILGVKPTHLVVPPSLEDAARKLINTETLDGGGSNAWKGAVNLIVTPYVS